MIKFVIIFNTLQIITNYKYNTNKLNESKKDNENNK